MLPAIGKRLGQKLQCFGSEVWGTLDHYMWQTAGTFLYRGDGQPRSNRVLCQLPGSSSRRWIYWFDTDMDADAILPRVTTGRLAGFGRRATNMGHDPQGGDTVRALA